jgi:hypothetical protein
MKKHIKYFTLPLFADANYTPTFTKEYLENCNRDSEFQPLGKANAEIVWENQDGSILVKRYFYKHTDPLTAPSFPYSEIFFISLNIGLYHGAIKGEINCQDRESAVETARAINKGGLSVYYNAQRRFSLSVSPAN